MGLLDKMKSAGEGLAKQAMEQAGSAKNKAQEVANKAKDQATKAATDAKASMQSKPDVIPEVKASPVMGVLEAELKAITEKATVMESQIKAMKESSEKLVSHAKQMSSDLESVVKLAKIMQSQAVKLIDANKVEKPVEVARGVVATVANPVSDEAADKPLAAPEDVMMPPEVKPEGEQKRE